DNSNNKNERPNSEEMHKKCERETSPVRDEDNELNEDELILQSFVSSILPGQSEDSAINSTLVYEDLTEIDFGTLNNKQKIIYERIKSHYTSIILTQIAELLQIIIMGTAGTGKSYLIRAIQGMLREVAKNNNINDDILLLLAPTGSTIHSALSIPITGTNYDLEGNGLKTLQNKLQKIHYSIIDVMSMVG
ncbi:13918_t:CDS:2, partial [Racocetra fulgida]